MYPSSDPAIQIKTFFSTDLDRSIGKWGDGDQPPEQQFPSDYGQNRTEPLIDGLAYFGALDDEITAVLASTSQNRFFYMTAWWLGLVGGSRTVKLSISGKAVSEFLSMFPQARDQVTWTCDVDMDELVLPKSNQSLRARLGALVAAGVDVRVLAWVSPFAAKYKPVADQIPGVAALNIQTLLSVQQLRDDFGPAQANHVMLNMLAHPLGAAHLKMVVCGDAVGMRAYTGGLDPEQGLLSVPTITAPHPVGWHDVAVRVAGPGAAGIYRFFQQLWKEQASRAPDVFYVDGREIPASLPKTPAVLDPPVKDATGTRTQAVQVLRTVPQMNFPPSGGPKQISENPVLRWMVSTAAGYRVPKLSFAPKGIFEFKVAALKAISRAERYVFIADQAFSSQEIMDELRYRLLAKPTLKVILLHGADPTDPPSGDMAEAINNHLLAHVPMDTVTNRPRGVACYAWDGVVVHSKVTIVDDVWCAIGSANCMRRSLYTDIELSVAIIDTAAPSVVQQLRRDLWARYCGIGTAAETPALHARERQNLLNLDAALAIWDNSWGAAPVGVRLLGSVTRYALPMPPPATPYTEAGHDQQDADSRNTF